MAWTFTVNIGQLLSPTGTESNAYAGGDKGTQRQAINNVTFESIPDVGPLPRGGYTFGIPVEGTHLGPLAIPLHPDPGNTMFGRSGFYCHGDTEIPGAASDGCIVTDRATREAIVASSDKALNVV